MASVSKQWSVVIKQVERQMASTLNSVRREELMIALAHMQSLRFSVKPFVDDQGTGVAFMTVEQCRQKPPVCHTMYIGEETDTATIEAVTAGMHAYGLVVAYDPA